MKIAITMRITEAEGYLEPRDSISHDWLKTLRKWEMMPTLIPNIGASAINYITKMPPDIIFLTGGEDVGEKPDRDETETTLFNYAVEKSIPIFGVCRGLQLINVRLGGQLRPVNGHVANSHPVSIAPKWKNFYASNPIVNSFHNIGIPSYSVAPELDIMASDLNGYVEAVQHSTKPIAAVMWHPERQGGLPGDVSLIRSLVSMAKSKA